MVRSADKLQKTLYNSAAEVPAGEVVRAKLKRKEARKALQMACELKNGRGKDQNNNHDPGEGGEGSSSAAAWKPHDLLYPRKGPYMLKSRT